MKCKWIFGWATSVVSQWILWSLISFLTLFFCLLASLCFFWMWKVVYCRRRKLWCVVERIVRIMTVNSFELWCNCERPTTTLVNLWRVFSSKNSIFSHRQFIYLFTIVCIGLDIAVYKYNEWEQQSLDSIQFNNFIYLKNGLGALCAFQFIFNFNLIVFFFSCCVLQHFSIKLISSTDSLGFAHFRCQRVHHRLDTLAFCARASPTLWCFSHFYWKL